MPQPVASREQHLLSAKSRAVTRWLPRQVLIPSFILESVLIGYSLRNLLRRVTQTSFKVFGTLYNASLTFQRRWDWFQWPVSQSQTQLARIRCLTSDTAQLSTVIGLSNQAKSLLTRSQSIMQCWHDAALSTTGSRKRCFRQVVRPRSGRSFRTYPCRTNSLV